jgi:hypothetical protein
MSSRVCRCVCFGGGGAVCESGSHSHGMVMAMKQDQQPMLQCRLGLWGKLHCLGVEFLNVLATSSCFTCLVPP